MNSAKRTYYKVERKWKTGWQADFREVSEENLAWLVEECKKTGWPKSKLRVFKVEETVTKVKI